MVFVVVQPEDHGRIFRDREQQIPIVAHALVAEELNLFEQLVVIVDLGIASGEHLMPEKRHFFFKRAIRVDQVKHPVDIAHGGLPTRQQ